MEAVLTQNRGEGAGGRVVASCHVVWGKLHKALEESMSPRKGLPQPSRLSGLLLGWERHRRIALDTKLVMDFRAQLGACGQGSTLEFKT